MKADIFMRSERLRDDGEAVGLMEPLLLGEGSRAQNEADELAFELAKRSSAFRHSLPTPIMESLATLVRAMNCYYSNLIEGHNTHPVDIERALKDDYSADARKRDLQLEARAHIEVQQWIDAGGLSGRNATVEATREIHRRFYEAMPEELRWVEHPDGDARVPVVPGEFRSRDVQVGRHVPVSPGAVLRFMERFESVYAGLPASAATAAAAAAHHRLAWIHPFIDGNGRVGRLMSHAILLETVDTGGVWSVSRGLARRVEDYKRLLAAADAPRAGDLDGRGNLSQTALAEFTKFFLGVCLDQVAFMQALVEPQRLRARVEIWLEEEIRLGNLDAKVQPLVQALLYRGELRRADTPPLLGVTDRHARRLLAPLFDMGVLTSASPRRPIRLGFPARLAGRWMPGLVPEGAA